MGRTGVEMRLIDRLLRRGTAAGMDDGLLLHRFLGDRDESAFAALVDRHGPMVLGVCRRVLRDDRDVEDAFQATFLVLVRRAGTIREAACVGPWLHGVAHRVATRARAIAARRSAREGVVLEIEPPDHAPPGREAERREMRSILDEELGRLPVRLRDPLILCHLEGLTHDQAAARLRQPVGTIRSRLSRGRDRLRDRLARRGVSAGDVSPFPLLEPLSPALAESTIRSALAFASSSPAAAPALAAGATALAQGALDAMITPTAKIVALALGTILTLGGASGYALQQGTGDRPAAPETTAVGDPPAEARPGKEAVAVENPNEVFEKNLREYLARMEKDLNSKRWKAQMLNAEIVGMDQDIKLIRRRLQELESKRRDEDEHFKGRLQSRLVLLDSSRHELGEPPTRTDEVRVPVSSETPTISPASSVTAAPPPRDSDDLARLEAILKGRIEERDRLNADIDVWESSLRLRRIESEAAAKAGGSQAASPASTSPAMPEIPPGGPKTEEERASLETALRGYIDERKRELAQQKRDLDRLKQEAMKAGAESNVTATNIATAERKLEQLSGAKPGGATTSPPPEAEPAAAVDALRDELVKKNEEASRLEMQSESLKAQQALATEAISKIAEKLKSASRLAPDRQKAVELARPPAAAPTAKALADQGGSPSGTHSFIADAPGAKQSGKQPPYLTMPGFVLVKSANGRVITGYSTKIGESKSLRVAPDDADVKVEPFLAAGVAALQIEGPKVERIAAFSAADGEWHSRDLIEPTQKASPVVFANAAAYLIGRRVYAFSALANSWDVLEFSEEDAQNPVSTEGHYGGLAQQIPGLPRAFPIIDAETVIHRTRAQLHIFSVKTGKWTSIDVEAQPDVPGPKPTP